jgi:NAD(P)-dependent dehydrogenase (short-subunit alcohol dehydrogenase family)
MKGLLAGRNAFVTGGSHGIGRAIAERFLLEGAAAVVVVDREEGEGLDPRVHLVQRDLGEVDSLASLVQEVERTVGPLDVLVNNAGVMPARLPVTELDLSDYRRVLAVNLDAPIVLSSCVARGMVERRYGRIVNITSIHGQFGAARHLPYDVSKAALNHATRTFAIELSRYGVLVNAIAPGFIATRLAAPEGRSIFDSDWFHTVYLEQGQLPAAREGQPDEVAAHVAWLASEQNTYVTGQILGVDGGLNATF